MYPAVFPRTHVRVSRLITVSEFFRKRYDIQYKAYCSNPIEHSDCTPIAETIVQYNSINEYFATKIIRDTPTPNPFAV